MSTAEVVHDLLVSMFSHLLWQTDVDSRSNESYHGIKDSELAVDLQQ